MDRAEISGKGESSVLQENQQAPAEPIKEYYIAYFDLLGYKEFFQNHPDKVGKFFTGYTRGNLQHKRLYTRSALFTCWSGVRKAVYPNRGGIAIGKLSFNEDDSRNF